jgi:asparagine synthase (glutamine-hydrolysing)
MCGIAGHYGSRKIDASSIHRGLELMHRRGPDHAAHKHWETPAKRRLDFLHTRLSIIDLDPRANQPFQVGSKWMVFNGELYNYVEVKAALEKEGVRFHTTSDTEVLLRAIDHWGWDSLDRCEGMWAFAVYDEKDQSLTLGRDRFGEKPLYFFQEGNDFFFASEAKFIAALVGHPLKVNFAQIYRYLVNGYKALYKQEETFFEGLHELAPASLLHLDASGRITHRAYWQPRFQPQETMSYEHAVAGVRERLLRAVEIRLRADVPLAFCMSGGVDSNTLISIAKNVYHYDVHGFTVSNSDARYEEEEFVAQAVKELKIRHTAVSVGTDSFLPKLRTLIQQHDAPIYTISYFAHWVLMQHIAKEKYRVCLSGTGADELFTGYYDHHLAYLYEVRQEPALLSSSQQAWQKHIQPLVRNPYLKDSDLFMANPSQRNHIYLQADRFASYLIQPWHEGFQEQRYTDSLLRNRMLNELFHESVPVILHEDDLNAMYYSIENRSPYLDRALFEFSYTIPSKHLIRDGYTKAVLRDAVRGIVPEKILNNRRKVGFNMPILSALDVQNPKVRKTLLEDSPVFEHVQREKIETLIEKPDLPNSESKFLFNFVCTKLFLEEALA